MNLNLNGDHGQWSSHLSTAIAMIVRDDMYAATQGNVFTSLDLNVKMLNVKC